jgi:hypothetical protein
VGGIDLLVGMTEWMTGFAFLVIVACIASFLEIPKFQNSIMISSPVASVPVSDQFK